ncbi:MAG: hypothetical protein CSA73_00985 [Rhodobacterales bacterium]|nr:MAG: hypothetical protein CSA73_00985 [Rhodobacterales bacterium]
MLGLGVAVFAPLAWAGDALPGAARAADVVILGEVHDNPAHHAVQADWVAALAPRAVVFEMLTEAQAGADMPGLRADQAALDAALGWSDGGWDAFDMYYPVLAASAARFYGAAVPRAQLRAAYGGDVIALFGAGAADYGLTDALPDAQLAARLDLQYEAHCEAMPRDSLGGMVEIQRLRDATLARAVLRALEEQGPPVAVVTGNGHARRDWGVPSYLARVAPGVSVFVLGQSEDGRDPEGGFDLVLDAPAVDRPDPCAVFRKSK